MDFRTASALEDCHRYLDKGDNIIFPISGNSEVTELEYKMYSYRPKLETPGISEQHALTILCKAAGITTLDLVRMAKEHYSVDSYDLNPNHIGERWPERQTDHSNESSEMSNLVVKMLELIEERNRPQKKAPKGYGTVSPVTGNINATGRVGGSVVEGFTFGSGVPDLNIFVR